MSCIISGDPGVEVCWIGWRTPQGGEELAFAKEALGHVAAHVGAALRIRRGLLGALSADDATNDAVLSPNGKVLHATGVAASKKNREALVDAAARSERARSKRRATAEERLATWTALVEAQWSIVDTVDRDGKRFLLARKNGPTEVLSRDLNDRERAVAAFAALGYSLKEISYEVGLSVSVVSTTLRSAMTKLNVRTRAALIRLFGSAAMLLGDKVG